MHSNFLSHMCQRWSDKGLALSNELVDSWKNIPETIDRARLNRGTVHAIALPTGCGKTEGLITWCGVSSPDQKEGILCVTRFKAEADRIAAGINRVSGRRTALAHHSDCPQSTSEMAGADVLVITHQALEQALSEIAITKDSTCSLDRLLARPTGKRGLILVDEAFDWIDTTEINLAELRAMAGALHRTMPPALQPCIDNINSVARQLTDMLDDGERMIDASLLSPLFSIQFGELEQAVRSVPAAELELWVEPDKASISLQQKYADLIQSLWRVMQCDCCWVSKRGRQHRLFAVRNLLQVQLPPTIIFDATAEIDPSYSLASSRISISRPTRPPRRYGNVRLHVSRGHRVGKTHLSAEAFKEWPKLKSALAQSRLGSGVLTCCHKAVRGVVEGDPISGTSFAVANWGALDGKNDWRDYSSIVLFGLPYLDDIVPTNALLGWHKDQALSWVAGSIALRNRKRFSAAYRASFIGKSVVQAVNRIHCRIPVDAEGNCQPTDVYVLLPNGPTGDQIVSIVRSAMPGLVVVDWQAPTAKSLVKPSPVLDRLVRYFSNVGPGQYAKSAVAKALGVGVSSIGKLLTTTNKRHASFVAALANVGTKYTTQTGRGCEAYFLKQ